MAEKRKHSVVAGAGAGGLAMALLLAMSGRKVTLLEATPRLGGALQRFRRCGAPFDTGFHFTGGFDGPLAQMLAVLNMADVVREEAFSTRLVLGGSGRSVDCPAGGIAELAELLSGIFPERARAIAEYFAAEKFVADHTPMFDLRDRDFLSKMALHEYDFVTLDDYLDQLGITGDLRLLLASGSLCHGTPPCEAAVTHHCRVSYGLDQHISRVSGGGDAFLAGFRREAAKLGIAVRTGVRITAARDYTGRECRRVCLSDGEELELDELFLAIHPRSILEILPPEAVRPGFRERVTKFEDSCGFFTVFGVLDDSSDAPAALTSYLNAADCDDILLPGGKGYGTGIVRARERDAAGRTVATVTAFRTIFPEGEKRWSLLPRHGGDEAYCEYKAAMAESVTEDIYRTHPEYRGRLRIVEAASMLSFRDYLPPTGCAYGVRRKMGEAHLFGRLPVRNFYAVGQSALVPGVLGTMMTSFLLFRQLAGEACYQDLIRGVI